MCTGGMAKTLRSPTLSQKTKKKSNFQQYSVTAKGKVINTFCPSTIVCLVLTDTLVC